ncbi:MAG: DUF389 domain-containing protein [Rhodobacteraceae bacterium]|uniref:DUF389 domain-containing protein n=1 Tax=Amaricoccus sp. TaxID=1872485 RepID=UPI001DAAD617|nr:DUF389 domain-containing protein [Amaricoccus sp.]MCB1372011.1 DUF389 domain-containing protein [Paracoccaceae bacterium]MCB1374145.1 DUF389 domain-containing protein [Paracoccaceae bacterium]MCC0067591.1 DUF389 domain-containing protein [Rhodovulum sp.]HRW15657.1 DUF389 domain-containing protein [Amaricoccus sp.]
MTILSSLLQENRFTPELVPPFESKLFFEDDRRRLYLERFGVLLFLSAVIATMGILSDSTAAVIGAMIIAPLMTPIMAAAAAIVTGRMDRAARSLALVVAGALGVVALSWVLGTLYSGELSFDGNSQITGRIQPRIADLAAALASGAAGAFCMSRDDIADSLPGVAIAISLVPPLCVVGIALSAGEGEAAQGALLLFVTNMLAILLAGGGLLAALGLSAAATVELRGRARRNAFVVIAAAVMLVTVPLAATSVALDGEARARSQAREEAEQWLAGTDFALHAVQVRGDSIKITINGPDEPPPLPVLAAALQGRIGRPVAVELVTVRSQSQRMPGTRTDGSG